MGRVRQAEQDIDAVLAVNDKVAIQKYIGNELTLANLFHLPNGAALMISKLKEVFDKYPNVNRWFKELQERKGWTRAAAEVGTIP